jgi:hypothetical protein
MDLYPYDLPGRPSWGANLDQLVPYLERTGAHNFEIHPTEAILQDVSGRPHGDELVEMVVGSMHQTFNQGGDLFGRVADARGVLRSLASITGMGKIQKKLPRPVPTIHYPHLKDTTCLPAHPIRIWPDYPGSFPVAQPKPDLREEFGNPDDEILFDKLAVRGIIGVCPDAEHDRCEAPFNAERWAAQFASGRAYQMHVSTGRYDLKGTYPDNAARSMQEAEAFTSPDWHRARNTELGDMVVGAIENYVPPDDLLVATGRPILRQVIEMPPQPLAIWQRPAQHARIVENLAHIAREAGATPLLWGDSA